MNRSGEGWKAPPDVPPHAPLRLRWLGIDVHQEAVVFMRADCHVCRGEGFTSRSRINVQLDERWLLATLHVVHSDLLAPGEASLSEHAWQRLHAQVGDQILLSHPLPPRSFEAVQRRLEGIALTESSLESVVGDVSAGAYDDLHLAALVSALASGPPQAAETVALVRAMLRTGERMRWDARVVADVHCMGRSGYGALPLLVVPILAANGIVVPMSVSRVSGAPSVAADVMGVLAPVALDAAAAVRTVGREGACVTLADSLGLSPVAAQLERVSHALGLEGEAQSVACVFASKLAAGVTHLLVDVPIAPRSRLSDGVLADRLVRHLARVASPLGLSVDVMLREAHAPLGRGLGPCAEALDVLAVLHNAPDGPRELRARALALAGNLLEFCGATPEGSGPTLARETLISGRARDKFLAICDAQGGFRAPRRASYRDAVCSDRHGVVELIDVDALATVARLAGAPRSEVAGVELHVGVLDPVEDGQPLYSVLAEAPGELAYALDWVRHCGHGVRIVDPGRLQ
jgi:thymidine phosphorylase